MLAIQGQRGLGKRLLLQMAAAHWQKPLLVIDGQRLVVQPPAIQLATVRAIVREPAELLALHAGLAGLAGLAGTPLHGDLESVRLKLRGFSSPRHNGGLDQIARVFTTHARGQVDYQAQHELIDTRTSLCAHHRRSATVRSDAPTGSPATLYSAEYGP